MTSTAQKRQRLNLLLITNDSRREEILLDALQESRTRCRLLRAPLGGDTLRYLERKDPFQRVPVPDLVFFDAAPASTENLALLRSVKARRTLARLPVVVLADDESQSLMEQRGNGASRSTAFAPVCLDDFLTSLNNAEPEQFLRAVSLLEKFGFVLVRPRNPGSYSNAPIDSAVTSEPHLRASTG